MGNKFDLVRPVIKGHINFNAGINLVTWLMKINFFVSNKSEPVLREIMLLSMEPKNHVNEANNQLKLSSTILKWDFE